MKPIAIFLAEKLEDIVSNENWLLVNNAADELRRLQAKVDQLEAASKPLTDERIAEMMMQTWGCASIAPRHAPAFARAIEAAHGIKGDA